MSVSFASANTTRTPLLRGNDALGLASPFFAPRGTEDDEFQGDSRGVPRGWTHVTNGTNPGSFKEYGDAVHYHITGAGTSGALYAAVKTHSFSVGDFCETAITVVRAGADQGYGLVIADGNTHGAGTQVIIWPHGGFIRLDQWTNWTTDGTNGTNVAFLGASLLPGFYYLRLKYEAANTWGLYYSFNGFDWVTVQSNYSLTLSPTHWGIVFNNFGAAGVAQTWGRWHYFRVNPAY